MRFYLSTIARRFRHWLLKEAKLEIRSAQQLSWISSRLKSPLPTTSMSLQSFTVNWVVNEILINKPKFIVELGAGTSTQILAQLFTLAPQEGREMISIEENEEWVNYVSQKIKEDGNYDQLEVRHVDRKNGPGGYWYNEELLDQILAGRQIDLLIVDGPSVLSAQQKADRARCFHYFKDKMSANSILFIDDANRKPEYTVLQEWAKYANVPPIAHNGYVGVIRNGKGFISKPGS